VWEVIAGDPAGRREMLPLRLMGAVHRLVLEGQAPALARHYPSVGGDGDAAATWPAFRAVVAQQAGAVRELLARPVQTNEVGRAAVLLGGFLTVAAETALPLRVLELGASAGLNLRWDHFRYQLGGGAAWGNPDSPVRLTAALSGGRPPLDAPVRVAERGGCDRAPVDPLDEEGRLTLLSYAWPDQRDRLDNLRGALELAGRVPVALERAGAGDWLERVLSRPAPGTATVVFHSIVWLYLPDAERTRVAGALEEAGGQAGAAAPLAWLRMEPGEDQTELRLTCWPGGLERLLATAHYHGRDARWLV
jgi:hypothetical protein